MKATDAVMWNIEVDPILRSTVTAVAVLDQCPDWGEVRRRLGDAIALVPRLTQRVENPRLPFDVPRWVDDPQFDLDYHLRRIRVPEPATMRTVLDLAGPITMEAFDPARPLWEFTLVEGLEGGGAALIQKFHHSIMDGEGAIALERELLDGPADAGGRRSTGRGPAPSAAVAQRDDGLGLVGRALALPRAVASSAWDGLSDPLGTVRDGRRLIESIGKGLAPVPESTSSLLRARSLSRRLDTIDLLLADLRAAGHACDGTVNDAFLAAVVGGLSRYHERHGVQVDELHLTMPVSVRRDSDDIAGNRFAPVRFSVPTDIVDPAERIVRLGELARRWQHEPFLQHTDAMATVLARLPAQVTANLFGAMLKHIDAVATNVPGLSAGGSLAGARIVREYAFAPPSGAALNIALLSHADRACIGIVLDTAAVPDEACFMESLVAGFDEVIAVADHHARRTA